VAPCWSSSSALAGSVAQRGTSRPRPQTAAPTSTGSSRRHGRSAQLGWAAYNYAACVAEAPAANLAASQSREDWPWSYAPLQLLGA
jgi:hypothetical protein